MYPILHGAQRTFMPFSSPMHFHLPQRLSVEVDDFPFTVSRIPESLGCAPRMN